MRYFIILKNDPELSKKEYFHFTPSGHLYDTFVLSASSLRKSQ